MIAKSADMRIRALLGAMLCAVLACTLVGCGPARSESASSGSNDAATQSAPVDLENAVVVYFSATKTTQGIADDIANQLDAPTFQLELVNPYVGDDLNYNDIASRVSRERNDASLRTHELVSVTVPDWDSYSTVFLGYPIWWGEAAWPVDDFVTGNDFSGKTVVPFCTSMTSGIGNSGQLLAEMAGTGDWLTGERFTAQASAEEVQVWLESL